MNREFLAQSLEEIALLLELRGDNPFKNRAYRRGAEIVRGYEGDVQQRAKDDGLKGIKGIGEALRGKLQILATTGTLPFLIELRQSFPPGLFELFQIQGLGPKRIRVLHTKLGIKSIESLKVACTEGRVAKLSGFGEKTQIAILESIQTYEAHAGHFLLGSVVPAAEAIREELRSHPEVLQVEVAGSYRRSKETLHDLDFLVSSRNPAIICEDFTRMEGVISTISCGETKCSIRIHGGLQCDLRAVAPEQFPFALQYFTGSKEHNVALRSRARERGLSLNEYGFTSLGNEPVPKDIHSEEEIYRALDLPYFDPELRENRSEFKAADLDDLPRLLEVDNLRGTFHNHTTASDGRNTLEEMAQAAIDLGLQYLGIADHSKVMAIANGLTEKRLLAQIKEIRKFNEENDELLIFAGSEVDILADGSLDFSDKILSQLDYCVASVHLNTNVTEEEMTRRICRAMENEHVTMLGHMTGRLLLRRDAYPVDHLKIIECAAETRTIIELNCNPQRLDMDWRWWKQARDKGVLCSINPDAHHVEGLQNLAIGARMARKGWLQRTDVVNTMDMGEIRDFLATPKHKRSYPGVA